VSAHLIEAQATIAKKSPERETLRDGNEKQSY